jgi:hypothetical protein
MASGMHASNLPLPGVERLASDLREVSNDMAYNERYNHIAVFEVVPEGPDQGYGVYVVLDEDDIDQYLHHGGIQAGCYWNLVKPVDEVARYLLDSMALASGCSLLDQGASDG